MNDVVVPLSTDEAAVLEIAAAGNSMMPIGRWEQPVLALTQRGLLYRADSFNYFITDAGRAAIKGEQEDAGRAVDKALGEATDKAAIMGDYRQRIAAKMDEIAEIIANICRDASKFSGEPADKLAAAWHAEVRRLVSEKLSEVRQ